MASHFHETFGYSGSYKHDWCTDGVRAVCWCQKFGEFIVCRAELEEEGWFTIQLKGSEFTPKLTIVCMGGPQIVLYSFQRPREHGTWDPWWTWCAHTLLAAAIMTVPMLLSARSRFPR